MPITLNHDKIASQDQNDADPVTLTETNNVVYSEYQTKIFDYLRKQIHNYETGETTKSLAVEAVAGSGKTTTIVAAAQEIPTSMNALFLAFNRPIADELGARLPSHVRARTLNSLGHSIILPYLKTLGVQKTNVNSYRTNTIIRKEMTFAEQDAFGKDIRFLVAMCKSLGVVPVGASDAYGIGGEATDDVLTAICIHHQRAIPAHIRNTVYEKTRTILARSFSDSVLYEDRTIDFDDQKWLSSCKRPNGYRLAQPTYDVVIIDEVQDVNAVDIELVKMVLKNNGIVIGVGDSRQAIYGFRGADTLAFETFRTQFDATTLPLSITYRCGKEIVRHAQEIMPTIESAPNAQDGEVVTMDEFKTDMFAARDMVLCRNNAPLIEFAFRLIKERIPVYVKGRNIGDNLVRLINDLVAEKVWVPNPKRPGKKMPVFTIGDATVTNLVSKLNEWLNTQIDLIREDDPDNEAAIQRVHDQHESIMVFVGTVSNNKVQSVVDAIDELFSDEAREAVVCATIHKAKGLEADRVFLYRPELMYPKWVKEGSWQWDQERNLDYVVRTRAKTTFVYLPRA